VFGNDSVVLDNDAVKVSGKLVRVAADAGGSVPHYMFKFKAKIKNR
jgi:hypothetical protein